MLTVMLEGLGVDPATSSSPFAVILVDVVGKIIYFDFAILLIISNSL